MKVFRSMLRNLFVAFALIVSASLTSFAQAPPSADAYVTSAQPAANFGISALLPVQAGTTSYVRLNLGALPANTTIAKATLRLYVNAVAAPGSFDVYQVESGWSEKGLSYNSAPALGASATGGKPVVVTAASQNQFILVDITPLAQGWLDGSIPNHGVALALTSAGGSFSFDSKESAGTGHQPELEVVFDGAVGALGASAETSTSSVSSTSTVAAVTSQGKLQGTSDPYVDNGTALQVGANFNIDGNGTAATLNATSQYLLGGSPVLGTNGGQSLFLGTQAGQNNTGNENTFLGMASGQSNTSGYFNTFVGRGAGSANSTGNFNTFIGREAGQTNTTGSYNSFFGSNAGNLNTTGSFNFFLGANTGYSNTTGTYNVFIGPGSGLLNTTGQYNTLVGANAGINSTTGTYNAFVGGAAGSANTSGTANTFLGMNSGITNTTGNNNVYIGAAAGVLANPAATQNVYIATQGVATESNTIRMGDPWNQTATYISGIAGATTNSGSPVFVDATGKLGTGGGAVNFTQVTGTLASPQFTGTYSNVVTLSNASNSFVGMFAGNGSALTGVTSGLSWPIVTKNADYTLQTSDFSTPTQHGNYVILTGPVSHTFTLPNPPPPNGSCVAIGNVADAGVNSGTNVSLNVSPNGLNLDATVPPFTPGQPRRTSYLYCSDGTGYYRLGYSQNGVTEIGPWLKTVDTGTVNALTTTFRNGLDGGLAQGSLIYLLPINNNTSVNPTLNVNGIGARRILKYGNLGLAPNDLTTTAYAQLFYDGQFWQLLNPQTVQSAVMGVTANAPLASSGGTTPNLSCPTCTTTVTATLPLVSSGGTTPTISCPNCVTTPSLTGATASIGGSALVAGSCSSGTATVTGATVGHPVSVSASDGSLPNGLIILSAAVTSSNTVTVQLCATGSVTPAANTYNVSTQ